jgi:hypothetical protein
MKITIHYNDCDYPIDVDGEQTPERNLDDLLDAFIATEVREIINTNLRFFRGMCDVWNQRELAQRRAMACPPLKAGDRVVITNPAFGDACGEAGTLEIEDGCWCVRFDDGTALGVGETDIAPAEEG